MIPDRSMFGKFVQKTRNQFWENVNKIVKTFWYFKCCVKNVKKSNAELVSLPGTFFLILSNQAILMFLSIKNMYVLMENGSEFRAENYPRNLH